MQRMALKRVHPRKWFPFQRWLYICLNMWQSGQRSNMIHWEGRGRRERRLRYATRPHRLQETHSVGNRFVLFMYCQLSRHPRHEHRLLFCWDLSINIEADSMWSIFLDIKITPVASKCDDRAVCEQPTSWNYHNIIIRAEFIRKKSTSLPRDIFCKIQSWRK